MNIKETNEDKIYVYSSFKQFHLLIVELAFCAVAVSAVYSSVLKCYYSTLLDPEMPWVL